jgi:hypothetical protein
LLKKSITYENPFTGDPVTEEHYFHISKADLIEMEVPDHKFEYTTKDGKKYSGMQARLAKMVDTENVQDVIDQVKEFIRRSYGKKDGDRFIKSKEIWEEFASTEAYSQLLWDLATNADAAGEFLSGIFPSNMEQMAAEIRAQAEKTELVKPPENGAPKASLPVEAAEEVVGVDRGEGDERPKLLTQAEVVDMDSDELKSGLAAGRYKLS